MTARLPSFILGGVNSLQEALLRRFFIETTKAVVLIDAEGKIGLWSAGAASLFSKGAVEMDGRPAAELFHAPAEAEALLKSAARAGVLTGAPALLRIKEGSVRALLGAEALGKPGGMLLTFSPASEGAAAPSPAALKALGRQAALGRMTAAFAHDIRTPLHVIASTAETLPGESGELILRSARCAADRAEALMSFARLGALTLRPGSVEAVFKRSLSLLEKECAKRSIRVKKEFGDCAQIRLDPHHLQGVFHNLILNAMEALPQGGTLTAAAGGGKQPWAAVADTGEGIPPELLKRLETPFVTTKAGGTGLCLYLSREILADHGATLSLTSRPGRGTEARIRFPRADQ